jgi:hypothetical protein
MLLKNANRKVEAMRSTSLLFMLLPIQAIINPISLLSFTLYCLRLYFFLAMFSTFRTLRKLISQPAFSHFAVYEIKFCKLRTHEQSLKDEGD